MSRRPALHFTRISLACIPVFMVGCASLAVTAPPVDRLLPRLQNAEVQAGRQIYLGKCTSCHSALPVRNYTRAEWQPILAEMAEETNLTPAQDAAVRAYVHAVLDSPALPEG